LSYEGIWEKPEYYKSQRGRSPQNGWRGNSGTMRSQKKVPLAPISLEPSLNIPTYEFYSPKNTYIGQADQINKRK